MTHNAYAFDEVLNFMAHQLSAEEIIAWDLPSTTQNRLFYLLGALRSGNISARERAELAGFNEVMLFMQMRKKQAQLHKQDAAGV